MNDIIFVRTRHHYVPYDDFFKLADLSGFRVIFVDEMLQFDKVGVIFIISPVNGEWNTTPRGYYQGRVILYQLEWNWDGEHNTPACVDEVWNCDPSHAARNGFKYVLMGSHDGLNEVGQLFPADKMYDVSQLSYQTDRRQVMTQLLLKEGLTLAPSEQLWGNKRSAVLMSSRIMLHVHQREDTKGIAPLRWCLAAAHRLPIVSEWIDDRGRFGYTHMLMAEYKWLPNYTAAIMTNNFRNLQDYGDSLHNLLCRDNTFQRTVEGNV